MEEHVQRILAKYYDNIVPEIKDVTVLDSSPDLGIMCIRWRDAKHTVTVKSISQDGELLLTELR